MISFMNFYDVFTMRNFYDVFTTGKLGYLRVIAPQGLPTRLRLGLKFRELFGVGGLELFGVASRYLEQERT